jgi:NAD(P)-dependent dehydrogenase (short-subunit alcohol dehydrogenase family)
VPISPEILSLRGKTAIITGAAMGLGAATALAFARCGAKLALCDREWEELARVAKSARDAGADVSTAVLDVRAAEDVARFVNATPTRAGAIDVLVNNAGGTVLANFADLSERGERALVDENWTSVTHFVRAALPHLARGASIINVTSIEAHRAGPGYAVYAAMKTAVSSFTKSLALELGAREIRVNCIAPDVIATPGLTGASATPTAGNREAPVPPTPLARTGHPDDVAGTALFLASDLSRFITGTTIHVDGGNHAAGGWHRRTDGSFAP